MDLRLYKPVINNGKKVKVGIIQTSLEERRFPCRYIRGKEGIQQMFGEEPKDYTIYSQNIEGDDSQKKMAALFHKAVDECDVLISLTGGYTSNCLLPMLDYELIAEKRPIISGYSDTTAVLLGILAKAKVPTVYGPALLGSFGEWPQVNAYTQKSFADLIFHSCFSYEYDCPELFSESNYFWDVEDKNPLKYTLNDGWKTNSCKVIEGGIVGGNLNTLLAVLYTPYCPELAGAVLFLEDAFTSPYKFMRDLESLKQKGVLQQVAGVVFGKFFQSGTKEEYDRMNRHILEEMRKMEIPAMVNVDFGHCYPMMSLPLGIKVRVDYGNMRLKLLESFCDSF